MNEENERLELDMKELDKKNEIICQRFKTLSDYNEEIIKFKDEYKSKNVILTKENEELKNQKNGSVEAQKLAKLKIEMEEKTKGRNC